MKRSEGMWWVGTEVVVESGADQKHIELADCQLIILICSPAMTFSTLELKYFGTKLFR